MTEFTDELKRLDLAINLPSKTYFAIEEKFKNWQPPKKLVEVPKCVADWFEDNEENLEDATWEYIRDWSGQRCDAFFNWFNEDYRPIETLIRMGLEGYTVKKEQKYILKHIDLSEQYENESFYLARHRYAKLKHDSYSKGADMSEIIQCHFTQSEIDKLHIGSYEQIEVEP